jgi:hypothetical protein
MVAHDIVETMFCRDRGSIPRGAIEYFAEDIFFVSPTLDFLISLGFGGFLFIFFGLWHLIRGTTLKVVVIYFHVQ